MELNKNGILTTRNNDFSKNHVDIIIYDILIPLTPGKNKPEPLLTLFLEELRSSKSFTKEGIDPTEDNPFL